MFQTIYNFFRDLKTPKWLKNFLRELQDLIFEIALQIGKDALEDLKQKIIAVSQEDIPGWPDKFKKVREYAWERFDLSRLSKTFIDTIIQVLVARLQKDRVI